MMRARSRGNRSRPAVCSEVITLTLTLLVAGAAPPVVAQGPASAPTAEPKPGEARQGQSPPSGEPPVPSAVAGPTRPAKPVQPQQLDEATGVLGKKVRGTTGEDMGLIVDVLVDANGEPRAAVVDFDGFLGVGNRKIAVDWHLFEFRPNDRSGQVLLGLERADIQAAPEYRPAAQPPSMVAPAETPPPAAQPPAPAPAPVSTPGVTGPGGERQPVDPRPDGQR